MTAAGRQPTPSLGPAAQALRAHFGACRLCGEVSATLCPEGERLTEAWVAEERERLERLRRTQADALEDV